MPELIREPSRVAAAGQPPKLIDEYVGRANTGQGSLSIAYEPANRATHKLSSFKAYPPEGPAMRAVLVREFGSYKVTNGQFIFRLQPTADSYNAASVAMAAATKRLADLEEERGALQQAQLKRWKNFVGN